MKKSKIIVISMCCLVAGYISYTVYEYKLAKRYALEICEMAKSVKDKEEIIKRLPSKEEAKSKRGTITISAVSNKIVALFVGALPLSVRF